MKSTKSQQGSVWILILKRGKSSHDYQKFIQKEDECNAYRLIILPFLSSLTFRRIRDELNNQNQETTNLTNKLDRVSLYIHTYPSNLIIVKLVDLKIHFIKSFVLMRSQEIHELRAQLEAAKYDVIKYCIGTLASVSAVGLAAIRILM